MRTAALLLLFLAACGGGTTTKPMTPEEIRAEYITYMDRTEEEANQMLQDLKNNRGSEAARRRLGTIRELLQKSQALRYRPPVPNSQEPIEIDPYFETFFMKLDQLEKAEWTGEDGMRLWDKLQFNCTICHGTFKSDD